MNIIINWFSLAYVCWNCCNGSSVFAVLSGVRQGGILSPNFLNLYVNCVITEHRKLNLGCYVCSIFLGCIMYADDLLLLSASVVMLQLMLNACADVGFSLGINFHAKKSLCMFIDPVRCEVPQPLTLNKTIIQWSNKINYLGVTLVSGRVFSVDHADVRR